MLVRKENHLTLARKWSESSPKWNATQNGMSLIMECHSKWNVTQHGMLKKNGMSLKMECDSK